MRPREHNRLSRDPDERLGAIILRFPAAVAPADPADDILVERLRNDDPNCANRCISQWADPLDAAILAALLLGNPNQELAARAQAAREACREAEARFWRDACNMLDAISAEAPSNSQA